MIGPRYIIRTEKPLLSLRYLRRCVLIACEVAVRQGDADPHRVLDELRGVIGTLAERWRGKTRLDVLRMKSAMDEVT